MMKNSLTQLTSDLLNTKNDKAIFLEALQVIEATAYSKNNKKILKKLAQTVPPRFFPPLELLVSNATTPKELTKTVNQLETFVAQIPVTQLTLSYQPTQAQLDQLANRIKERSNAPVIIDYTVNNSKLGLRIEFAGKIYQKFLEVELTP